MANPSIHHLKVSSKSLLTRHMTRVVLEGPSLADFPVGFEGGYVKLVLPRPAGYDASALDPNVDSAALCRRSFTVRAFDREARRLVLDFVVAEHPGAASDWFRAAKVGDEVLVSGPGPVKSLVPETDWILLVADMTALPALSVQLERLPGNARGMAVIEVLSEADHQKLIAPEHVKIHWVITPNVTASRLADVVREQPWHAGRVSFWAACEFGTMKKLRRYFFEERGLSPDDGYLSSYWKIAATDEQHKAAKRADSC